ncbi:hypothetical protein AWB71_00314 [Caballeronia peredens]|nr:hypothetical protein AWB71_00314 [Caballeronia peredens]
MQFKRQREFARRPRGLDFLMADVRDGLGPFLSVFLKNNRTKIPAASAS